jgi:hypothetical protein
VGKTSEREGVLLISSISGNYISIKIKPTEFYLSLPSISVLEIYWKKPKSAASNSVLRQSYRTDCHSSKCCTDFLKNVPRIYCSCTTVVQPVRTDKCALSPQFACSCTYCSGKITAAVPNPYCTDSSCC